MREWGYGEGYRYAHDYEGGYVEMRCLPDEVGDESFYRPSERGFERRIAERMRERGQLPG
jgi:putative ATPase